MITDPILAEDIHYNAAMGSFEARVTVHGAGPAREYACSVDADLSLTADDAEKALRDEALRRHMHAPGLFSFTRSQEPIPLRTRQNRTPSRSWFARLESFSGLRAA